MKKRTEDTNREYTRDSYRAQIGPEEIRAELERLFPNPAFKASQASRVVLRYLVEEKLTGNENRVGGDSILARVTGGALEPTPEIESIARIRVNQLRRSLKDYYRGPGAGNPVRIEIPLDCCTPEFYSQEQ